MSEVTESATAVTTPALFAHCVSINTTNYKNRYCWVLLNGYGQPYLSSPLEIPTESVVRTGKTIFESNLLRYVNSFDVLAGNKEFALIPITESTEPGDKRYLIPGFTNPVVLEPSTVIKT